MRKIIAFAVTLVGLMPAAALAQTLAGAGGDYGLGFGRGGPLRIFALARTLTLTADQRLELNAFEKQEMRRLEALRTQVWDLQQRVWRHS